MLKQNMRENAKAISIALDNAKQELADALGVLPTSITASLVDDQVEMQISLTLPISWLFAEAVTRT